MTILATYHAACDEPTCTYEGPVFLQPSALSAYLDDTSRDGKWLILGARHICRGCIIDRACRIFGHDVVLLPVVLDPVWRRGTCTRCARFMQSLAVAS